MKPIGQHGCNVSQSHNTQIYTNTVYIYIYIIYDIIFSLGPFTLVYHLMNLMLGNW